MASKREQVLDGVLGMAVAALPYANVGRNMTKPERPEPGGMVNIGDGDPGDPEVLLSPLSYTYSHRVRLDVAAYEGATKSREQVLDEMFQALSAAIEADRTLGGLCEWIEPVAPSPDDAETSGTELVRWAEFELICVYTTSSPLA